jgi:type IV pilus biogenesis protein CpaD/CtpE
MTIRTSAVTILLLLLQACSTTPRFDSRFGAAVRANLAAQTIYPNAAGNPNPATGIDGVAARAAHERYQRSFVQPDGSAATPLLNTLGGGK